MELRQRVRPERVDAAHERVVLRIGLQASQLHMGKRVGRRVPQDCPPLPSTLDWQTGTPIVGIDEKQVPQIEEQKTPPIQPHPIGDSFVPQVHGRYWRYPTVPIFTPFHAQKLQITLQCVAGSRSRPPYSNVCQIRAT
jgi:hypothetical protein